MAEFFNIVGGWKEEIEGYGQVVSRAIWRAVAARGSTPLSHPVPYVFTLDAGVGPCDTAEKCDVLVQGFQRRFMETKSKLDLPFNFIITSTGFIYEGRGWNNQPELPSKYKLYEDRSIFIGIFGHPADAYCLEEGVEASPDPVIPRSEWQVLKARRTVPLPLPVKDIFTGFTQAAVCQHHRECVNTIGGLQRSLMDDIDVYDLPFNFIIGGTGGVYEVRGWTNQPHLPDRYKEYDKKSLYIAFMGFRQQADVTQRMMEARNELLKYAIRHNYIDKDFVQHNLFS